MAAYAADKGSVQLADSSSSSNNSSSSGSASNLGAHSSASAIPVYVAPTYQVQEQQQQAVVHETVGYIQVPMQASAQQVYQSIQVRYGIMRGLMK
jgi:hypothetical protein